MSVVHLDLKENNMSLLFDEENRFEQTAPAGHCSSVLTFLSASWGAVFICVCYVCLATYNTPGTGLYLLVFTGYSEKWKAIDTGKLTISSPKLNRFSLTVQSWGHGTQLGSVFIWSINKSGSSQFTLLNIQAIQHSNCVVYRLSIRTIKIPSPTFAHCLCVKKQCKIFSKYFHFHWIMHIV